MPLCLSSVSGQSAPPFVSPHASGCLTQEAESVASLHQLPFSNFLPIDAQGLAVDEGEGFDPAVG